MSKPTDLGIYLKSNKTFYYLEYGENFVQNTLDRLKKALVQRDLLTGVPTVNSRDIEYEIISFKDAYDNSLEMTPIYISKHVRSLVEASKKTTSEGGVFS
jgi:hypothetical protein